MEIDDVKEGLKKELLEKNYCNPGDDLLWIINKWFNKIKR